MEYTGVSSTVLFSQNPCGFTASPRPGITDQFSEMSISTTDSDTSQESVISDCESAVRAVACTDDRHMGGGLVRLGEGERVHVLIKQKFLASLGLLGAQSTVVAIHRNSHSSLTGQARLRAFQIYMKAVEVKCGGNANVKCAWYSPSSKEEISNIMDHGFDLSEKKPNGIYGRGVYLAPADLPSECMESLNVDEDGLRHLMLCRVILGKQEVVQHGNYEQYHPSSAEVDSGVDQLNAPKKYIVWSTHMNTRILPEYVVSFRAPASLKEFVRTREPIRRPSSPWMPIPTLIGMLQKYLPRTNVALIVKFHKAHREKKISRNELIQKIRQIAGDKLLATIIKSFRARQIRDPRSVCRNGNRNAMDNRNSDAGSNGPILFGVNLNQI